MLALITYNLCQRNLQVDLTSKGHPCNLYFWGRTLHPYHLTFSTNTPYPIPVPRTTTPYPAPVPHPRGTPIPVASRIHLPETMACMALGYIVYGLDAHCDAGLSMPACSVAP